ncbi:MAG: hypothetical protein COW30_15665 [Rhodospirillales bacterium CG15_BIG_FIL_POST_REV_8_21_14_020_66_15]|nr:MAG: hypothetical protein COW30_15665 [Rhodospirillales bacterium CG15_BIG_FIL_POST_REV_8_21_14_020_66_15]
MFDGDSGHFDPAAAVRFPRRRPWRVRLASWLRLCRNRARQRRALSSLDTRMLADIGVSHAEAARECTKPFWR